MKHLIFLAMLIASYVLQAQPNYEATMMSALDLMEKGKLKKAEGIFERVSQAEKDKWLPHYYIAQINSMLSWNEKDATLLKAQLDKAQGHVDIAKNISPNNPEILIMQAMVYTNWVAYDGQTYGMKYSAKINELYEKAVSMDPRNPRAVYCKAEWEMGSARFFGKDVTLYCADIKASLDLFANFKPESSISPNWGERRAAQLTKECNLN